MVRHFVRLKLRILANRLRAGTLLGTIGFVAIWMAAVILGGLLGLGVFGFGRVVEEPGLILILAYTLTFVGWMVLPAALSALDETLDPRRFELLPLSSRKLTTGLLAAGVVSPGAVGTLIGLVVATFASFPQWPLVPFAALAVLVELLMCLVVARLVTSLLASLLASRRTRELVTLAFAIVIGLVAFLPSLLDGGSGEGSGIEVEVTSLDWLESAIWLPPGAVAGSVSLAADGEMAKSILLILYGAAATLLIGWAWARTVRRTLVTAPNSGGSTRRRADHGGPLALTPAWLRIRSGPVGGVAAKELRYLVRDNRMRSQLIGSLVPVLILAFLSRNSIDGVAHAPFLAALVAYMIALGILSNQFGADGGSFWGYVVSAASLSSVIRGKNLGWGAIAAAPALFAAVVLSFWSGHFAYLVAAILGAGAVLLVATTIGNFTSIYGAQPIPEGSPFGSRGFSGNVFVAVILSLAASGFLLFPLLVVIGLPAYFLGPVPATLAAVVGVGYGLVLYRLGMRLVTRLLVERQQILLDTIDGEKG